MAIERSCRRSRETTDRREKFIPDFRDRRSRKPERTFGSGQEVMIVEPRWLVSQASAAIFFTLIGRLIDDSTPTWKPVLQLQHDDSITK